MKEELTGRYFFKRNWLGFLILHVEVLKIYQDKSSETQLTSYRKASEIDLMDLEILKKKS